MIAMLRRVVDTLLHPRRDPGYPMSARSDPVPSRIGASFRVAVEVLAVNREGVPATFALLQERLAPVMGTGTLKRALTALGDWGIVKGGWYAPHGGCAPLVGYVVPPLAIPVVDDAATRLRDGLVVYVPEEGA